MAIQTREKKIGDTLYRVRQLDGETGSEVRWRLLQAFMAGFSSGRGFDVGLGLTVDPFAMMGALAKPDRDFVRQAFAESTTIAVDDEGNAPKARRLSDGRLFAEHFGGTRLKRVDDWVRFAWEVNFGDGFFSEALADASKELLRRLLSGSRAAATGSSTDSDTAPA